MYEGVKHANGTDGSTHFIIHTENQIHVNNLSHKHLVDEDAHPPPVHCSGVVVVCQDLRSQKFWSPTESRRLVSVTHPCKNITR